MNTVQAIARAIQAEREILLRRVDRINKVLVAVKPMLTCEDRKMFHTKTKAKRFISAAGRKAIRLSQAKRWAKWRREHKVSQ